MLPSRRLLIPLLLFPTFAFTATTTSTCTLSASTAVPAPSVAPGYSVRLVATNLTAPRGIIFDSAGHLLVVQQGVGVEALTLTDNGGSCVGVTSRKTVVADSTVSDLSMNNVTCVPHGRSLFTTCFVYPKE